MTTTSAPTPATPSRSRRVIAISLAIIAALVAAFFVFANLYADFLWYEQLGFDSVLLTQWMRASQREAVREDRRLDRLEAAEMAGSDRAPTRTSTRTS